MTNPEADIKSLADQLMAQIKAPLDQRDVDLAEKLHKQVRDEIAAIEAKLAERTPSAHVPGLTQKEAKDFSFGRLIRAAATRDFSNAGYELDLCKEAALTVAKDMNTTTDSAGGYIVPAQVMSAQIIPLLVPKVTAFGLGVERMEGLSGSPVQIPRETGGATTYWVSPENTAVTTSDLTFGQMSLTPHTLAAATVISENLANLSSPAAESVVKRALARDLGVELDATIYNGSGASGEPAGVLQTAGVNTVAWSVAMGTVNTYDLLIDMIHKLAEDNALEGSLGWVMHPNIFRELRQLVDPSATKQLERRILTDAPFTQLLGYPFAVTTNYPTNNLTFANWADVIVGQWGTMTLSIDSLRVNRKFSIQILAGMVVDVGIRRTESICNGTSISGG